MDSTWIIKHDNGGFKITRCECFNKTINQNRLKKLKIPKSFENIFITDFKTDKDLYEDYFEKARQIKEDIIKYFENLEKFDGIGFYLYSEEKGSGKTFLLAAIGNEFSKLGYTVRFAKTMDILTLLKESYQKNPEKTYSNIIDEIKKIDVLLIDDIGVEKATDWVNEQLNFILDYRLENNKITFFTSNKSIEELELDERIISRLYDMVLPINFPEISIREKLVEKKMVNYYKALRN